MLDYVQDRADIFRRDFLLQESRSALLPARQLALRLLELFLHLRIHNNSGGNTGSRGVLLEILLLKFGFFQTQFLSDYISIPVIQP